jgi:hypothetical protein
VRCLTLPRTGCEGVALEASLHRFGHHLVYIAHVLPRHVQSFRNMVGAAVFSLAFGRSREDVPDMAC